MPAEQKLHIIVAALKSAWRQNMIMSITIIQFTFLRMCNINVLETLFMKTFTSVNNNLLLIYF